MKSLTNAFPALVFILLLNRIPITMLAEEPSLQQWFTDNSYINNVLTDETGMETFSPGHYHVQILAEIAAYAPNNTFGWYSVTTGTFHELFSGENKTEYTAEFSPAERFGLYLASPDGTFHTEDGRSPDEFDHAWVFQDPKTEDGYIIAWEDLWEGGDKDYQDMIIAMRMLRPPHAAFNWSPQDPQVNEIVTFDASAATPNGGTIVSYKWDLGDDDTTTIDEPLITHIYSTFGNYTVTLTVTDSDGKSDSISNMIKVRAHPHAAFTYSPLHPQVCEDIVFDASGSTPDGGYIINYEWNFGDSSPLEYGMIVTHHYMSYGEFTVTLNVSDTEEKWDTESKTIMIRAHPKADFTYSPISPEANEEITFDASTSTPDGGYIVSWEWDFGDYSPCESGVVVTHNYSTFGNYTVTVNVTDSEGKWDIESKPIVVTMPPLAAFIYLPSYPQVFETITFDASGSTPDGGQIVNYEWDFGDFNITTTGEPIIKHSYTNPGNYTVTLTVTDTEGKNGTASDTIRVRAHPNAEFSFSPQRPKVYETVTFNASESTPDGGYIVSYKWDFDDGSPYEFGVIVIHQYTSPGDYTVTLNVTDSEGKSDTKLKMIEVQKLPEFAVRIHDELTWPGNEYEFETPAYCKTLEVEVWINNVSDMYGYEFWLDFDPSLIQLTEHDIIHVHTEDFVILEEIDNATGLYKQTVTAEESAEPCSGSMLIANLRFHIINDPCYPCNYTGLLRLDNTRITDPYEYPIEHSQRHGYFKIISVRPEISIECEGGTEITNWIVNKTFTLDITLANIVKMKSFYVELGWCGCLETDYQKVEVTNFLPPPYKLYKININDTLLTVQVETSAEKPPINGTGTILRVTFKARNPWGGVPPYSIIDDRCLPENYTSEISIIDGWIDIYCPEYRRIEFYDFSYGVSVKNDCSYAFTPVVGDLNLDGRVDVIDLSGISRWTGFESGDPEWTDCYNFDLNNDDHIDLFDVVIVATNFGRNHP